MNLFEYKKEVIGELIDFDWYYGAQCVDLIRHYTQEVLETVIIPKGNAADLYHQNWWASWEKIDNDGNDINQTPNRGDIVFWDWGIYWHTAVVLQAYEWIDQIDVLEQNTWDWNWYGGDDAVKESSQRYWWILGWYRLINNEEETMKEFWPNITDGGYTFPSTIWWVPIKLHKSSSHTIAIAMINWYATEKDDYIALFEYAFDKRDNDEDRIKKVLRHELSHFVYHRYLKTSYYEEPNLSDLSLSVLEYWESLSERYNSYISDYAKTQEAEDFAECVGYSWYIDNWMELPSGSIFNKDVRFKYIIANNLYKSWLNKHIESFN